MQDVATLAVVDDREESRQQELRGKEGEYAEAVKTQRDLLLLVILLLMNTIVGRLCCTYVELWISLDTPGILSKWSNVTYSA